jgi:hypothetical protein
MSQVEKIGQGVTFDGDTHTYRENGVVVESVTQVLNDRGLVCYDHIAPRVLKRKAEIGTAAHTACWFFDDGDLDWTSVDESVVGYVRAWARFRAETDFIPRMIETRGIAEINSKRYGYTFDREGLLNNIPTLIEIKCTAGMEPSWGPQTAAYEYALRATDGCRRRRVAVWLKPDGKYSLNQLSDVWDYFIFRIALTKPIGWQQAVESWLKCKGKAVALNGNADYSNYID